MICALNKLVKMTCAAAAVTTVFAGPVLADPAVSFSERIRLGWEVWFRDVIDGELHTILRRGRAVSGLPGADFYYCVFNANTAGDNIQPVVECIELGEK